MTEEINEKVLKSLQKMAEQQNKSIQIVQQGSIDDLKKLLALVADEVVSSIWKQNVSYLGPDHVQKILSFTCIYMIWA